MQNFWNSILGKIIRWILFLPISIIIAVIVGWLALLINQLRSETQGDWAYMAAAFFAHFALLIASHFIVPNFKRAVVIILVVFRTILSLFWFIDPETSMLSNTGMLILQELSILGVGIYYCTRSSKDSFPN